MKKPKISIKNLIQQNKEEILKDQKKIEKIEKKMDERYIILNK
jgi:hypothetical protein